MGVRSGPLQFLDSAEVPCAEICIVVKSGNQGRSAELQLLAPHFSLQPTARPLELPSAKVHQLQIRVVTRTFRDSPRVGVQAMHAVGVQAMLPICHLPHALKSDDKEDPLGWIGAAMPLNHL